jgi:hypothetical protein
MAGRFQVERDRAGSGPLPRGARSRPPQLGAAVDIAERRGIIDAGVAHGSSTSFW